MLQRRNRRVLEVTVVRENRLAGWPAGLTQTLFGLLRLTDEYSKKSMRVRVLVFGVLKDLIPQQPGNQSGELDLPRGARVGDILEQYRTRFPGLDSVWASLAVAVNRQYVTVSHLLEE